MKEHIFKGEFANILVNGGYIISAIHDRIEWLYLVKVADTYKSQLSDTQQAKFVRIGEDNTIHGEYYADLRDAKNKFKAWCHDNRVMHLHTDNN